MNIYEKLEYLESQGWKYIEVSDLVYGHNHRMLCPPDKPLWEPKDGESWCASNQLDYLINYVYYIVTVYEEHKRRIENV